MFGSVTEVFDRVVDVLVVAMGLGCVWLGCRAVLRPRRPPEPIQGPVWGVRAWGLGFVLLGISLAVEAVTSMAGGQPGWPTDVIRWVAGPLVVGAIVTAIVARGRQRRRARTVKGRQPG